MRIGRIGSFGEDKATIYLQNSHYEIIQRNFQRKWGEIDIIAKDKKTKELVFVEVKTRQFNYAYSLNPEEALTSKKVRRLKRAFLSYLNRYDLEDKPWRFDFIAVEIDNFCKEPIIRHYKDIFLEF
ncbi:MAG TPA: YraN family protein [Bacteroidetes bacterium]|nr:YraN family protein [Bacteroidota bacterium]